MTEDERKKRRADLRFQKHSARYQSLSYTIVHAFAKLHTERWTLEKLLQHRADHVLPYQNVLPTAWRCSLEGVWDACWIQMFQRLVFCYRHPDTGVMTPACELCDGGLASRLVSATGAHCHVFNGQYVPFNMGVKRGS